MGDHLQDPVLQREHVVTPRFGPPQLDQLGDLVWELGRTVVDLGDVVGDVIELPHVVFERRVGSQSVVVEGADRVEGHGLPPVVVDRSRSEHLEVLGEMAVGCDVVAAFEDIGEARAVDMRLLDPVDLIGRVDADDLEHGWEDVDGVRVLPAERVAAGRPARQPVAG